jgi:CheY-like chemotaxis protein
VASGSSSMKTRERRILVVDDNPAIHADFRKILGASTSRRSTLDAMEAVLFPSSRSTSGGPTSPTSEPAAPDPEQSTFLVDFASQGQAGVDAVARMVRMKSPYAVAFVDMRMPPGLDGVETAARMWQSDAALQIVICTAYSDYSWHEVVRRLNRPALHLLQKPFDSKDVLDLAWRLTNKWLQQRE